MPGVQPQTARQRPRRPGPGGRAGRHGPHRRRRRHRGERVHGCYVRPTVLAGITPEMAIWREEVFGPVLALRAVAGFDAAVEAVNDSGFGLAAAVFTRDLGNAYRFADEAECGQVAVNSTTTGWDVHLPFGGFRDSGTAYKEQGDEVLRFSTRVKTVAIDFGTPERTRG
ncbi:aldehyde dehydrogenase family protein [Streptomyces diastatochromogenes]|nr:aldehyde dehydrogenase family protein [Streptomyces diastatochromogenes]